MPAMEPTMNQSALLAGYCPDVRLRLQMTSLGETPEGSREAYRGAMEHSYKALPETWPGVPGAPDPYSQRSSQPGGTGAVSAGVYPSSLYLQTQALLREAKAYEPMLQERCSKLPSWQQQHKQQLESLRMQVEQMQLSEVEQRAFQLQGRVRELEVCLEEARSHTREKDIQLEEKRRRERELLTTVTSLQERVQEGLEDGARLPSLDVEIYRGENSSLREEQQRLKKVTEKQLRMTTKRGTQIVTLEEQVSQEESSSHALREEVCSKEQGLLQLRTAMEELSAQNQELTEQNLTLGERLEDSEKVNLDRTSSSLRPAGARLTQRLHVEIASCLCDLCNVLTQQSQGRDPNLSLLLGVS
uniref:centrosomal protein of 85 kDa-like isoform X3 n=1 Tax=Oncorhynchus gorbuscha TaxID=8017 RepID=UPI001EAECE38|nr:centrosomal protein of 85 kDa-like isoform X3 [Oncorhynchus gorbuscha]